MSTIQRQHLPTAAFPSGSAQTCVYHPTETFTHSCLPIRQCTNMCLPSNGNIYPQLPSHQAVHKHVSTIQRQHLPTAAFPSSSAQTCVYHPTATFTHSCLPIRQCTNMCLPSNGNIYPQLPSHQAVHKHAAQHAARHALGDMLHHVIIGPRETKWRIALNECTFCASLQGLHQSLERNKSSSHSGQDLNPRPSDHKSSAVPLSHGPLQLPGSLPCSRTESWVRRPAWESCGRRKPALHPRSGWRRSAPALNGGSAAGTGSNRACPRSPE